MTPTPTATRSSTPRSLSPGVATGTPASEEIQDGILKGNHITRALELYYLDQSQYPPTLDDLVPVYLPALPTTLTGQPYFYRLFDATDPMASEIYWLSFRVLEYWDCSFATP
jgi:hypothetical protein